MNVITQLSAEGCKNLLEANILPFWLSKMIDKENGGFYGRIDGNNRLHPEADKVIILNTRILWTFSAAYQVINKPEYLHAAMRSFDYITSHFIDEKNGGVYWSVNYRGEVEDAKKQIYAQAFTIYALAEFYKLTNDQKVLGLAISLFKVVERYSFDLEKKGYLEAFDRDWNLLTDLRLSDKDANEAKTMNTHLHILEAYTNLYQVWKNDELRNSLEGLIHLFLEKFLDSHGHLHLFFDEDWNLKSDHYSYGHDIEGGWLLLRAAEACEDEELVLQCRQAAVTLTNAALRGMDEDGGLMNEGNLYGVEDTDKHWWPQAEALVGLINAHEITGDKQYLVFAEKSWEFIEANLIDRVGEWHWMVHKDGTLNKNEDKAGPWKCPYHNGRAMLELMARLRETSK